MASNPTRPAATATRQQTQQQQPRTTGQVARVARPVHLPPSVPKPTGLFTDPEQLNGFLEKINDHVILLSPMLSPDHVPEFCAISVRYVMVNPDTASGEVYLPDPAKKNELALTKAALDRIAQAAGISWFPDKCYRDDNRSDPHYAAFKVAGAYRSLDRSFTTITGNKEVDLRDGNPRIFDRDNPETGYVGHKHDGDKCNRKWCGRWRNDDNSLGNWKGEEGFKRGWSQARLDGAREHLLANAETKAKLRAVRSYGIKAKYSPAELQKPFAILALVVTGQSHDPQLDREMRQKIGDALVESTKQLFGPATGPTERVVHEQPHPEGGHVEVEAPHGTKAPPPIGQTEAPDDEGEGQTVTCLCPEVASGGPHLPECPVGGADPGDGGDDVYEGE